MSKHRVNRNRILCRAAAAVGLLVGGSRASAQLVYEPFNYTASSALDAKVNSIDAQAWSVMSNNGADDDIVLTAGNVAYTGLAAPVGNFVSYSSTGKSERLGFDQTVRAGTLYYSLSFRLTSLGTMTTGTPVIIGGFSDRSGTSGTPPTTIGARLYLRTSANSVLGAEKFNIGVSKNDSFNIAWDTANDYTLNTPIFVVGSYQVVGAGSGTDDVSKMWVNPATGSLGSAAAPGGALSAPVAGTDLTVSGAPSLAGFVLRQGTGVPSVQLDELRVDTSWARVTQPAGTTWNTTDGAFDIGGNWSAGAPNSADVFANFGTQAAPRTVTVASPVQLRSMTIDSSQSYTFAAGGGAINLSGAGGINVRSGSHTINAPVSLGGESLFSVATAATLALNGDFTGGANAFTRSGDGTLNLKHLRAGATNLVAGQTRVAQNGGPTGTSKVTSLVVNTGASLDLRDNDLVIDYVGASPIGTSNGSTYTGVTGQIVAGRNGGTWDGSGIRTTQPDAMSELTSLGVGDASSILGLGPGQTAVWSGQIVDDTSVLVRYTYAGDANLDGVITGDDYSAIDFSILVPGTSGWANGDFNYDGVVTGDDYSAIDFGILAQGPSLGDGAVMAGVTAVPEPALVGVLPFILAAARRGRRP